MSDMTFTELRQETVATVRNLYLNGDPWNGDDWLLMRYCEAIQAMPLSNRPFLYAIRGIVEDAMRYRWLRSEGLQYINFKGLTCDTSDVGLDFAIDQMLTHEEGLWYE